MVVLGIDIGGSQIKAGMVDEEGAILASRTIPTPAIWMVPACPCTNAIQWLLDATALPAGVGVGCKGIINPDSTQVEILPGQAAFPGGLAAERRWWAWPPTCRYLPITTRGWRWRARWCGARRAGMRTC